MTFSWNISAFEKDKHTITVQIEPIQGETDTADNTFTDGTVTVTIPCDADGDFDVDIYDVKICAVYRSNKGEHEYNANLDINDDDKIDLYDAVIACAHYGQKDP